MIRSLESSSVPITVDKDFGELVFRRRQASSGVLLVRLPGLAPALKASLVSKAIQEHGHELPEAFAVLIKPPVHGWITSRFALKRFARYHVHQTHANSGKNSFDGFRFLADSCLRLVVGEPIQAIHVQIDLHERSRETRLSLRAFSKSAIGSSAVVPCRVFVTVVFGSRMLAKFSRNSRIPRRLATYTSIP